MDEPLDALRRHLTQVVDKTWNFSGKLKTVKDHHQNAAIGLATEAAEFLDVCKKDWYHDYKDRRDELRAELGDVCYYLAKTLDVFGFTLEEVLDDNKRKLTARHKERFENEFSVGH